MNKKNYRYCLHINWHQSKKIISVSCVSCFRFAFRSQFSSNEKGRPMNDKFMRSVIKLGKMKKFTVDTAMFIIRRGVIYFLGALRNLLSANQFRQCQYLPRFARAIIPWIMFFEAAAVLYAWKGTWKSVQKYRDQIEFSWFTVGLWNRSQQYRPVIFDSRFDVFHTETLICLYAKLWPVDMQNLIFFSLPMFHTYAF